jgi:hypothetical protein
VLSHSWAQTSSKGLLTPREGCPHSGNVPADFRQLGATEQGHNELKREAFQAATT